VSRRLLSKDKKINSNVEQIYSHFGFLFDRDGFEIIDRLYDSQNFGNWTVLLRSDKLFMRIVQDRNDIYLSIGPHLGFHQLTDSHHLLDIDILVNYIKKKDFDILPKYDSNDVEKRLQELSSLLSANYDEIITFIDSPKYSEEKDNINKLRSKKIKDAYPYVQFVNEKKSNQGGTL